MMLAANIQAGSGLSTTSFVPGKLHVNNCRVMKPTFCNLYIFYFFGC